MVVMMMIEEGLRNCYRVCIKRGLVIGWKWLSRRQQWCSVCSVLFHDRTTMMMMACKCDLCVLITCVQIGQKQHCLQPTTRVPMFVFFLFLPLLLQSRHASLHFLKFTIRSRITVQPGQKYTSSSLLDKVEGTRESSQEDERLGTAVYMTFLAILIFYRFLGPRNVPPTYSKWCLAIHLTHGYCVVTGSSAWLRLNSRVVAMVTQCNRMRNVGMMGSQPTVHYEQLLIFLLGRQSRIICRFYWPFPDRVG